MYRISALAATSSIHPVLYAVSVRTVGISPRTSSSTVCYLPAVVLQVWASASSRLRADFHRSTHIASVVPKSPAPYQARGFFFKGGRWDSNPRQPEPQSGALPLNYVHHCVAQRAAAVYTVARWDASQILHLDAFFYFEAEKRVVISL